DQSNFTKQIVWFVISLVLFFVIFRIKTETLFNWRYIIFWFLVASLAILLIAGMIVSGVKSWFKIGFISIQCSEFIKIPLALIFAKTLAKISIINLKILLKLLMIVGIPFGLITLQPDLGTASILATFIIICLFLKRVKFSVVLILVLIFSSGLYLAWNYILKSYQKDRIISFINPQKYRHSTGYQIIQSKIAIGSGGLMGKGYLKGSQSQYKFIPTRHTDFIIAVLGEEMGFMGISFLFILFLILFYRQFNLKAQMDEEFYFVYLFNGLILFQFFINVLMSIGYFPILGVPLPFVSYGGSSLLSFFIGEAIIFKIKINPFINEF
ncbi:MAG: rod shape-determining protein RodA, partial [Candidatus Aminicenantes bacterium]|nr:rod shape-determining protein RodA [Candidatus Aminicenantes bacterium]